MKKIIVFKCAMHSYSNLGPSDYALNTQITHSHHLTNQMKLSFCSYIVWIFMCNLFNKSIFKVIYNINFFNLLSFSSLAICFLFVYLQEVISLLQHGTLLSHTADFPFIMQAYYKCIGWNQNAINQPDCIFRWSSSTVSMGTL